MIPHITVSLVFLKHDFAKHLQWKKLTSGFYLTRYSTLGKLTGHTGSVTCLLVVDTGHNHDNVVTGSKDHSIKVSVTISFALLLVGTLTQVTVVKKIVMVNITVICRMKEWKKRKEKKSNNNRESIYQNKTISSTLSCCFWTYNLIEERFVATLKNRNNEAKHKITNLEKY